MFLCRRESFIIKNNRKDLVYVSILFIQTWKLYFSVFLSLLDLNLKYESLNPIVMVGLIVGKRVATSSQKTLKVTQSSSTIYSSNYVAMVQLTLS